MDANLSQHIATRPRALLDAWSYMGWLPNPDPVLKAMGRDITTYRDLRSDPLIGGAIRRRRAAVLGLERGIRNSAASGRITNNIRAILNDCDIASIIQSAMDACLYGYQPVELVWGKVGSFIVPTAAIAKPPEWFVFDADNQLRFRSKSAPLVGEALPDRKFLLLTQDATYANPYGFPDLSMCFWPTAFKKGGLKFWVTFAEKYGMPFVVGKQPRHATVGDTDRLLDQLENMVQDAVAVIPDDASIDIMQSGGTASSADNYERLLMFCRAEVSTALLGSNLTTESSSTNASAQAGLSVAGDIRDGDAQIATKAINTVIDWICNLNFDVPVRPVYELWDQESVDAMQAGRDERLSNAGAKLSNQYFMSAYGLREGDLLPQDTLSSPANFSEADPAEFADQSAIDGAVEGINLQKQADVMLMDLLSQLSRADSYEVMLGLLADAYPNLDMQSLAEKLGDMLFAAGVIGRLTAKGELDAA
ncbi:MAG: hypothetical protein RI964_818 [Pseudomonadota bacterium]